MSDYRGHDRPYPTWFPYFLAAIVLLGATFYATIGGGSAPTSRQIYDDIHIARHKATVISKRRA